MARSAGRLDHIAQNVANAVTPGYKARRSFVDELAHTATRMAASESIDMRAGKMTMTGRALDFAIEGPGWFTVRSPQGEIFYTRNGAFTRREDGRLATARGDAVQGERGDLRIRAIAPRVTPEGVVVDDGEPIDRLAIVEFTDEGDLVRTEGGLFQAHADGARPSPMRVAQGALETSNVELGSEMIATLVSMREAQTGQQLTRVADELLQRILTNFEAKQS